MPKNKPIHITYIGRLVPEKGTGLIIDAIRRSRKEQRDIVWHICGDG
jgi:glycosyltransferase involved in cell wall biosynthesis